MGWFLAHNSDFLPRGNGVTGRSGVSHGPLGYDCAESTPQAPGALWLDGTTQGHPMSLRSALRS